ncbi:MAG: HIT domain-containing protein [Syntrophomonas sp.]
MPGFISCNEYVLFNELSYVIYDRFPVTPGHMLIIPKRHASNFFDTTPKETSY